MYFPLFIVYSNAVLNEILLAKSRNKTKGEYWVFSNVLLNLINLIKDEKVGGQWPKMCFSWIWNVYKILNIHKILQNAVVT